MTRRRRPDAAWGAAAALLRRRRGSRRALTLLAAALLAWALWDRVSGTARRGDGARYDQSAPAVMQVIDGDTFRARFDDGESTLVRMIGIDAPELRPRDGAPSAHWADEAEAYLRSRLDGARVVLRVDPGEPRDRYGRLLAYVYPTDGEDLNLTLIAGGHAYAYRTIAHERARQYEQAENEARRRGEGLWANVTDAQMPEWRQAWLKRRSDAR